MNRITQRSLPLTASALVACLGLSACGGSDESASDLGLKDSSTLVVCADVPFPPFEEEDSSSETGYKGFDVDVTQAIADGMGVELEFKDASFDSLQSGLALNSGQCDLSASGMTITEERKKNLTFSDPYYDSLQSLLVKPGQAKDIDDLDGKKLAVQQGSTGAAYAKEHAKGAELVFMPSDAEMFQALRAGQVVGILQDHPVNLTHTTSGDFEIVGEFETGEQYGLAVKKDNEALVKAVNEQLKAMRDSGEYDKTYDKYFSTEK